MSLRVCTSLFLACLAFPAGASTFDIYGFGPRAMAMGGALGGGADDSTASYYNPASLTSEKTVHLGIGLSYTAPFLYVDRAMPDSEHPTVLPGNHGGINFGWKYPVGGVFQDKVALGVSLHLPFGRLMHIQGFDPTSPQFYLYQNLHDKLLFVAAVAYEPTSWLSLGVGVQVLADLAGTATLNLDIIDETFESAEAQVDIVPTGGPILALHARPWRGWQLGLTYRASTSLTFSLPVGVHISEALALDIGMQQNVLWTPDQWVVGLRFEAPRWDLSLGVDLTWARWSEAPDPSTHLSIDFQGKVIEGVGLGDAVDVSTDAVPIDLGFVDTWTPRFGLEWNPVDFLMLRAGYFFRATPAPRTQGSAMYLDNHAHVLSLGVGFVVEESLGLANGPLELDFALQSTVLVDRTVMRLTAGDPIGSLSHGGNILTGSMSCSYRY